MKMYKKLSNVKGFENCTNYYIYDDGRVYSLKYKRFLNLPTDTKGYKYLDIRRTGSILKCPKIHKLVMLAFSYEEPKEQINHIDGNKHNNNLHNLEYVSNKENRNHALITNLKQEINYGIAQYDMNDNLLNVFNTAQDALRYLGKNDKASGNIGRCIKGYRKSAYGYKWQQYEGSTTIPNGSTLQANGSGNGECPK